MADEKDENKRLADSLNKKGFYMTPEDYKESLNLLRFSEKAKRMQENLLDIYKKQLNKKSS